MIQKSKRFSHKEAFQKVFELLENSQKKLDQVLLEQHRINFIEHVAEKEPPNKSGGIYFKNASNKWEFVKTSKKYTNEAADFNKINRNRNS